MKRYAIKEIHYTIQGEGAQSGRPAVFVRFSGCNLWSGREEDRSKAICQFCDTDFWGTDGESGGKYTASEMVRLIKNLWPNGSKVGPYVVCTGGEPSLQLDAALISALHDAGIEVGIETNGTIPLPAGIDWICMSPKANTEVVVIQGDEIKIIYPQEGIDPRAFENMDFTHFYIQPMDSPELSENTRCAIEFCKEYPQWKLSIQTHKILDIP